MDTTSTAARDPQITAPVGRLRYVQGGCGPSPLRYPQLVPGYEAAREWAQPIAPGPGESAVRVQSGNALILSVWRIGPEHINTDGEARKQARADLGAKIGKGELALASETRIARSEAEAQPRRSCAERNILYLNKLLGQYRRQLARWTSA